jgi:hypothetical protein
MTHMARQESKCESCGAELPHVGAICSNCDAALRSAQHTTGKHLCPICAQSFNKPIHERCPRNTKWFLPSQFKPTCPHCHGFLRDRKSPRLTPKQTLAFILATIAAYTLVPQSHHKLALAILLGAYIVVIIRRTERNVTPQNRYAKDAA